MDKCSRASSRTSLIYIKFKILKKSCQMVAAFSLLFVKYTLDTFCLSVLYHSKLTDVK